MGGEYLSTLTKFGELINQVSVERVFRQASSGSRGKSESAASQRFEG